MLFENSENNKKRKVQDVYPSVDATPVYDGVDNVFGNDSFHICIRSRHWSPES